MAQRRLNVLVYTGTGASKESIRHAISTFRSLLTPNYAIIPITESVLLKEPWASTCALLVFPGGQDLGYCRVLNGDGNQCISDYVRRGGSYLGLCAGGYYGSQKCEFEKGRKGMEVIGNRELRFFAGTCRGAVFPGFEYGSESGARAVGVSINKAKFAAVDSQMPETTKSYFNGGGVFVDASKDDTVEVLAEYDDDMAVDGGSGRAAVILCKMGQGQALLTGTHPEFSPENLSPQPTIPEYNALIDSLKQAQSSRIAFLKGCLAKLGLQIPQDQPVDPIPKLSTMHLVSNDTEKLLDMLCAWDSVMEDKSSGKEIIKGEADTFQIIGNDSLDMKELMIALEDGQWNGGVVDYSQVVKKVIMHENGLPDKALTPRFDIERYFESLRTFRKKEPRASTWGDILLYADVTTSTNSILEKNPKLISRMQTGFTFAATTQVAGRGRGSNVWVAPPGSLLFSTVINHPASMAVSRPVVFIQYLAAVAIVEAIQAYGNGYEKLPVKLKWPNDIYAADPTKPLNSNSYVKIGGILSQCGYSDGSYQIVLGIGLNVNNPRPTTSLSDLVKTFAPSSAAPLHIESLLAAMLTQLESIYAQFQKEGFSADLESRYYRNWLHTGQSITLEGEAGKKARVIGITRDWGMLKVEETDDQGRGMGREWALQSDENSFDYWKGLVRRKL